MRFIALAKDLSLCTRSSTFIGEKLLEIVLIQKDTLLSVPSCDDMIQCPRKMDSRFAYHGHSLSKNAAHVNTELPLPDPIASLNTLRWAYYIHIPGA